MALEREDAAHDATEATGKSATAPATQTARPPAALTESCDARIRSGPRRATDRLVLAIVDGMSEGFLAIGPDWRIRYANAEAGRIAGAAAHELVGTDHWARWPETVGSPVERHYRRTMTERTPAAFVHFYPRAGVWHDIRAYPSQDDGGIAVFFRDVSSTKLLEAERARQAEELAAARDKAVAAETQFQLLVERVRDYAVFLVDPNGVITHWGRGAERMQGWRAEEAIGQHLRLLYPSDGSADDGSAEEHLAIAARAGEYTGEGTRVRRGGDAFAARTVLTALRREGELVGFSTIMQDLTNDRERESALEQAIVVAESANRAKSQFLANTSHEIRTPLNAIMGYAELLEIGLAGQLGADQRAYVARIQGASRHLLSIINDVLDLAKIESGEVSAAREAALTSHVVRAALLLVEPQARARGIALVNACPRDVDSPAFLGDPERVRQILVNLLSNAIRFTERGGRVTVSCGVAASAPRDAVVSHESRTREWAFLRVEDTGVGIAPTQLERIWDAFVQLDATHTRTVGGTGLGLTISRYLARLMDGDITVHSQTGLGSTFVVWLPQADRSTLRATERDATGEAAPRDDLFADPERVAGEVSQHEAARLRALADAFITQIERLLAMYVARLRADPDTRSAARLSDSELEDHAVTLLADLGQSLAVVGTEGPEAIPMLRDGSAIQQLIASRHGEQRSRLGWSASQFERELDIFAEEIHAAVRRAAGDDEGPTLASGIGILNHFVAQCRQAGIAAFTAALAKAGENSGPRESHA